VVAAATVGLAQRPLSITELPGPAAAHAHVLPDEPATALLAAAALLDAASRAGGLVPRPVPLPAAAPDDPAPELSPGAADVLRDVLAGGDREVLADLLGLAGRAGVRLPPPDLPAVLAAATAHRALREPVAAVLGARGRWLAAQHPDWRRVVDTAAAVVAPDAWETGFPAERVAWLADERRTDPESARETLAAGWAREVGDDRAALLGALRVGLGPGDEAFLERALDDRRADVREVARALLAALPESSFTTRARRRAASVLSSHRGRLVVTVPAAPDEAGRRDGLTAAAPPGAGRAPVGESAWRVFQVVATTPLATWEHRLDGDPAAVVARPMSDEFVAEVRAGWRVAAIREGDARWAAALLTVAADTPLAPPDAALTVLLPEPERIVRAVAVLAGERPGTLADVAACPPPWPAVLTDAALAYLGGQARSGAPAPPGDLPRLLARRADLADRRDLPGWLRELADRFRIRTANVPAAGRWAAPLERAADLLDLRRRFARELP